MCTTEFIAFSKAYPQFRARNTQLIGLSVDGQSSHLAWVYNIYRTTGIRVPFPLIEDSMRNIAQLYGMVSEAMSDTVTVRTVFIIDPDQIVRCILYYPLTTGRFIPEILRIIDALQTTDKYKTPTPANWLPGMPVIVPAPKTYDELLQRVQQWQRGQYNCTDWYLCFTQV